MKQEGSDEATIDKASYKILQPMLYEAAYDSSDMHLLLQSRTQTQNDGYP